MKSIYSIPKVVKYDDLKKSWFVYFRYNKVLYRFKYGINYINNYKERESEANALRDALHQKLKEGWNPSVPEIESENKNLLFTQALDFAIEKKSKNISVKTLSGYNGTIKFIKAAIIDLSLENLTIIDTKRSHIKLLVEKAADNRKWSNNAYNKHLNHLKAILSELLQWDIIEVNPAHNIKNKYVEDSIAHIPANENQHKLIKKCLQENHPYFYNFMQFMYYSGARPKEILQIKLSFIDIKTREILLPAKITKGKISYRNIVIDDGLLDVLLDMEIEKYPKDFYLFGSFREPGKGNVGKYIDFIPGPTSIKRDTATKRYKKIVKDGLGIDITMYSYKGKGGDDKLRAGVDLDSIRNQYGHTNKKMTKVYVRSITGYYKEDIIKNSTKF